jgi:hypothetical protein
LEFGIWNINFIKPKFPIKINPDAMKNFDAFIIIVALLLLTSCGSVDKIARHDFYTGYYKFKPEDASVTRVYVEESGDSLNIYNVVFDGRKKSPDTTTRRPVVISTVNSGDYMHNSTFHRNSFDIDLTTAILKYRPSQKDVPRQLNANLNAALYAGLRKDYFKIVTRTNPLKQTSSSLRHFGFDAGFFAGFGITPVNFTVTSGHTELEYVGIVFEKGLAVYFGIDFLTFGISLGFDNLLDENHKYWVYNQKPWIGLMLGIANF